MVIETIAEALRERFRIDTRISLDEGEVYRLLSVERRRELIRHLAHDLGPEETTEIGDAAVTIAAVQLEKHPDDVTSEERKVVYTTLYQQHLPKLDDLGVIEWDQSTGAIAAGRDVEPLADLLRQVESACSRARYPTVGVDAREEAAASIREVSA